MSALARRVLGPLLAVAAFVATFEAVVRFARPTPRAQIVRAAYFQPPGGSFGLDDRDVLLWTPMDADRHDGPPCDVPGRNVLLVGSSIFYGSGVEAPDVVSARLAVHLAEGDGPWCVRNVSAGSYAGEQKLAALRRAHTTFRPDVVVWEAWYNDSGRFVLLDGDGVETSRLVTDDAGYPTPLPLPSTLSHALWRHSAAWRFASLALTPLDPDALEQRARFVAEELVPATIEATRDADASLIAVIATRLDRPFAESSRLSREPPDLGARERAVFEAAGVPVLAAADLLADLRPEDVGVDRCCHLNALGHDALARALVGPIREAAARSP